MAQSGSSVELAVRSTLPGVLPSFDLVVPTIGRVETLRRLLESVVDQSYPHVRLIIVDKSPDAGVAELAAEFDDRIEIVRIPAEPCSVVTALNIGLRQVDADVVGMPDDDCWYPAGLLHDVADRFRRDASLDGLTVVQRDVDGGVSHGRWARRSGVVTRWNVWNRGVGPGIFYRTTALAAVGLLDETLGLDSGYWEAGGETDLLIRLVDAGFLVRYEAGLFVFHPDPDRRNVYSAERWRGYAEATGHVMRKHHYPVPLVAYHVARPVGGAALALLSGDRSLARSRLTRATGRLDGWRTSPRRSDDPPRDLGLEWDTPRVVLPSVDLVVTTRGRATELERLLHSLAAQDYSPLRVILVDQNEGDATAALVSRYSETLDVLHLRVPRCGVSQAKNTGISHTTADVVGLPDDDCWYPDGVLRAIGLRFAADPSLGGITVVLRDHLFQLASGRWGKRGGPVTRENVWGRGVGSGMFFRRSALVAAGPHDESLGTGSGVWEAGEETDILIRVVDTGSRVHYDPALFVHHPDPERDSLAAYPVERFRTYAEAMGHVMRLHQLPARIPLYYSARQFLGAVVAACAGDRQLAHRRIVVGAGRLRGWLTPPHARSRQT